MKSAGPSVIRGFAERGIDFGRNPHGSAAVPWTDDDTSDWRMRCNHWFSKERSS
ncbi:hypothetical protein BIFDEN_02393 [Bifidobacterium dentium ATCC 27678]|nr:hypothetical protein BIFDEN_02393 [Bifidobacterium dentium ATCC 27678]